MKGFIPFGKFNANFLIISWTIILFTLIWENKKTSINFLIKKLIVILIVGIISFIIYIYPYFRIYNYEQIEDHLINFLNFYLFIIAGFQYTIIFKTNLKNLNSLNTSNYINFQKKL